MIFSLFSWLIVSLIFIFSGILSLLFRNIFHAKHIKHIFLVGLAGLIWTVVLYLPRSEYMWNIWNIHMLSLIDQYPIISVSLILKEVWFVICFFRSIWPAVVLGVVVLSWNSSRYPLTVMHRTLKNFSHNKILILILSLLIYTLCVIFKYSEMINEVMLNIAVYIMIYYWQFGFFTILNVLRQNQIHYLIGTAILVLPVILAGENFLLPIIACTGIGISDIWMDYHHRNSGAKLFSLDFR
ncbi:MAG: hypothetical protein ACRCTQ_00285 [Brevinemataceae bacterium]